MKESLNTIKLGIERIESEKCPDRVQMKAKLRTLKDAVKGTQDSVNYVQLAHLNSHGPKSSKKQKIQHPKDAGAPNNRNVNRKSGLAVYQKTTLRNHILGH